MEETIHYRCSGCSKVPAEEIYLCRNGHTICKQCFNSPTVTKCPANTCQNVLKKLNPIRGRNLENVLKDIELCCRFKLNGCDKRLLGIHLAAHELICEFEKVSPKTTQGEASFSKYNRIILFSCFLVGILAMGFYPKENFEKDEFPYQILENTLLIENEELALAKLNLIFKNRRYTNADPKLQNILPYACLASSAKIVKFLIEKGFLVNNLSTEGFTPLHFAILNKKDTEALEISKILLENGADCNIKSEDEYQLSPLQFSEERKGKEFSQKLFNLFEKLNPSCTDFHQYNKNYYEGFLAQEKETQGLSKLAPDYIMEMIRQASMFATWDGVKYLLEKAMESEIDVNSIDCGDLGHKYNLTYLHLILLFDKNTTRGLEKIKFLVEEKGANIHAKDVFGMSLLHVAARNYTVETVEYFLSKGLDINETGKRGETPLSESLENEDEDEAVKIAITLLKYGADCDNLQEKDYEKDKWKEYTTRLDSLYRIHKPSCFD